MLLKASNKLGKLVEVSFVQAMTRKLNIQHLLCDVTHALRVLTLTTTLAFSGMNSRVVLHNHSDPQLA